ncbi:MAG: cob(I)yrinic acid a,c-diamide adenosyltransferase [Cyclobacteriaceae bacterium]
MKIYTKTGDRGETSLYGGKRVSKDHVQIDAYGTVDELNSHIGLLRDHPVLKEHKPVLVEIQDRLFTLGSHLAADPDKPKLKLPPLYEADVTTLEKEIDKMDGQLEPMRAFILPGGNNATSFVHIARCVCRRAERNIITQAAEIPVEELVIQYMNRLSDYLFTLSRWIAKDSQAEEIEWKPRYE